MAQVQLKGTCSTQIVDLWFTIFNLIARLEFYTIRKMSLSGMLKSKRQLPILIKNSHRPHGKQMLNPTNSI